MNKLTTYRVIFLNHGVLYEIYARHFVQASVLGFIEIGDLVFGEISDVVVDPAEERLKKEFSGVKRAYIPMHAVIRIDEVEKEGISKVKEMSDKQNKVTPFPLSFYTTTDHPEKS